MAKVSRVEQFLPPPMKLSPRARRALFVLMQGGSLPDDWFTTTDLTKRRFPDLGKVGRPLPACAPSKVTETWKDELLSTGLLEVKKLEQGKTLAYSPKKSYAFRLKRTPGALVALQVYMELYSELESAYYCSRFLTGDELRRESVFKGAEKAIRYEKSAYANIMAKTEKELAKLDEISGTRVPKDLRYLLDAPELLTDLELELLSGSKRDHTFEQWLNREKEKVENKHAKVFPDRKKRVVIRLAKNQASSELEPSPVELPPANFTLLSGSRGTVLRTQMDMGGNNGC